MLDRKKLAVIHIVKKELGLTDAEYRGILQDVTGVRSAKDLDDLQFRKLMYYFVRSRHYRVNSFGLTIRQKLYIKYLANILNWDEDHLRNFLHKYYRKTAIDQLDKKEGIKVIESLKNVLKHQH